MMKNYFLLLLLLPVLTWSQGIAISTNDYTPTELVNNVLLGSDCLTATNITSSAACGIGYFNANASNFPFAEGLVISNGQAINIAGSYTGVGISSVCSNQTDANLQQIVTSNGQLGNVQDASFIEFVFVAPTDTISFNYIFASQEYGTYQCSPAWSDAIAFILTELTSGVSMNMATIPGTTWPVSASNIRNTIANPACTSFNEVYFDSYNVANPETSTINMKGQTIPMHASAGVIPGHTYSLKIVVGDIGDTILDSAVFIEGGSFFPEVCGEAIEMVSFLDTNTNGIKDEGENNFNIGTFSYQINNSGNVINTSSANGNVVIGVSSSADLYDLNFTIDPVYASYFTNTASYNDILIDNNSGSNIFYFPITNTQPFNDVTVSLISNNQPQPGFSYYQKIIVTNNGTLPSSGSVSFSKDPLLSITSVSETGIATTPTGFTYGFTDLLPNESLTLNITSLMPTIPTVTLGNYITNSVTVATNTTEITTENNNSTISEIIVGSYDPNDKMESHGAQIPFQSFDADDYLEYTIRFQNTGTFYATKVSIEDELEAQLNLSSFQMLNASHPYTLTRINNKLVWSFDNILLPSTDEDENASQGYVRFRIKPNTGFAIGDIITNEASIIFDFNPPIVTNLFATEFTTTLSAPDFDVNSLVVYPNPAHTTTTISSRNEIIETLKITDITGKVIKLIEANATTISIDVSDFSSGIYLLELKNSKQEHVVKKLIIE